MTTGQPPEGPGGSGSDQPTEGGGAERPQGAGWGQPPPGQGQPPPGQGQGGWGQQQGYGQQQGGWGRPGYGQGYQGGYYGQQQQGGYGQQGGYYGYPSYEAWAKATQGPSNSAAVGGFITSICSLGLLLFILGLSAPFTVLASIAGTIVSRKGIKNVESGQTQKNKDLAQWGFWLGIAGVVLSLIAIAIWAAIFIAADETSDDYEFDSDPYSSVGRVLAAVARLALG
jgi:hypothetical protein